VETGAISTASPASHSCIRLGSLRDARMARKSRLFACLAEIIQIIGRATRDAPGKVHAQFTNLIAEPDASSDAVVGAVNNMLKAIACSLLMEQVLAPKFYFRTRADDDITGARKDVSRYIHLFGRRHHRCRSQPIYGQNYAILRCNEAGKRTVIVGRCLLGRCLEARLGGAPN
jgi:hypothetical protein